jgi:hypothetical protein
MFCVIFYIEVCGYELRMFIFVLKYSRIGCVYVIVWNCVVDSYPVIKNNFAVGIGLSCECRDMEHLRSHRDVLIRFGLLQIEVRTVTLS